MIEIHHYSSARFTQFGSLRPLPPEKTDSEEHKTAVYHGMKNPMAEIHTTRTVQKKMAFFFDDFVLRSGPRRSEHILAKKRYTLIPLSSKKGIP